jgi:acyl-CoA oxidase
MGGVFSSHFGLFGSSVLGLGTRKHRDILSTQIDSLSWLGALALTELGHGSNVNGIETTAHYDVQTREFILNTPTESAQKIWVGGATTHTRWCVVYAQLHLASKNEGVHAFLVPIRNDDGTIASHIRIADHGAKFGQNGVDSVRENPKIRLTPL